MSQNQQQLSSANGVGNGLPGNSYPKHEGEDDPVFPDQTHKVPVTEAIKYRRRAQIAEQQVEQLTQQLDVQQQQQQDMQERLDEMVLEKELAGQLVQAGATDIEVVLLLAKEKMKNSKDGSGDLRGLIERLRNEKPQLFSGAVGSSGSGLAGPTAGVRGQSNGPMSNLSRLAQQAQRSGNRKDMQEYLRQRRAVRG